ncbi:hypothetical protein ACFQGT_12240 [Natrialbaceae archaeon GCM10025810]|uniref:hypothetical protein n=1 Tax=Halovalidus salilacus TaxID=3075124 RepID=UPI00360BED2B
MHRRGRERAVTVQIGAILLFAILFAALALYQVDAVPAENRNAEIDHSERVGGDLVELRNAMSATSADGAPRGSSVALGTRYEVRTFTVNPPDPAGTIRTQEAPGNVSIEGDDTDVDFETQFLVYEPGYHEYGDAPTTRIEHTFLYGEFDDATVDVEDPLLIDGDRVVLPIVDGDLSRADSGTASVDVRRIAGPNAKSIDSNVTVTLPTDAPERWNESLGARSGVTVEERSNAVELEIDGDAFDEIALVQLGVGDGSWDDRIDGFGDSSGDGDRDDRFNVEWLESEPVDPSEDPFEVRVTEGGTPVEDAQVDFSVDGNGSVDLESNDDENRTDESGIASVNVTDGSGNGTVYAAAGDDVDSLHVESNESATEPDPEPEFETLEATPNVDGQILGYPYTRSVTFEYDVSAADSVERIEFTVFDEDGAELGSATVNDPDSPTDVDLNGAQWRSVDLAVTLVSEENAECLETTADVGETRELDDFEPCE